MVAYGGRAMRRVALLLLVSSACARGGTHDEANVRGAVRAADGRIGVPCTVEIGGMPPLFTGDSTRVETGATFSYTMKTSGKQRNMYAAVRCDGYATAVSRQFDLEADTRINLGEIIVGPK